MAGAPGGVTARLGVRVTSALAAALVMALVLVAGGVALVVLVGGALPGQLDGALRTEVTGTLTRYVLVAVPILIVVTGLVSYFFAGRGLSAVEAVRERAAAALDEPLPEPMAQDEVARLAETLDALVGRVTEAGGAQHRLAAAGPELRAPLAAVAAGLDRIQRGQADRSAVGLMRAEIDRLARQLDTLLAGEPRLDRPDDGPPTEVTRPVPASGPLPVVPPRPVPPTRDGSDPTTVISAVPRSPREYRPMRDEDAREDPITHPRGIPVVRTTEATGPRRYPQGPPSQGPPQHQPQNQPQNQPQHQSQPQHLPGPPPHPQTNPRGVPVSDPRGLPPDPRGASGQGW
jgi:hypothetical protein